MPQEVTVRFISLEFADDVYTRVKQAQVWATANVQVAGGRDSGDHVIRRQLHCSNSSRLAFDDFKHKVDAEKATKITVRFKVETTDGPVGMLIVQAMPPPFHQDETTTVAARSQHLLPRGGGSDPPAYELKWEALNGLVVKPKRTVGPYPAARDVTRVRTAAMVKSQPPPTTTTVSSYGPNCWEYNPENGDTLVVDQTEYKAPVSNLINWQIQPTQRNRHVFHQRRLDPPNRHGRIVCRDLLSIKTIVLHETGEGWSHDNPWFVPANWASGWSLGAHFNVASDGQIIQYYDAVQKVGHVSRFRNTDGVGIEFSNYTFPPEDDDPYRPPHTAANRAFRKRVTGWSGYTVGHKFLVPPLVQLEALHALVQSLLTVLPNVPAQFRALDAHGQSTASEQLFLMSRWSDVYNVRDLPGLYSHQNVGIHYDGSFQAMYLWIRAQDLCDCDGANDAEKAYNAAIHLTDEHLVYNDYRTAPEEERRRYFVDVTSVHTKCK